MADKIGSRIREMRNQRGFLQDELAKKIGVSRQVLSNWERGYTPPDSDGIARLAKLLEVPTDYLLFGKHPGLSPQQQQILEAIEDDEELVTFFLDAIKQDEFKLLFKQVKPLKKETIKRIIKYIKLVEDEEADE